MNDSSLLPENDPDAIREKVRERYAGIGVSPGSCCGTSGDSSCCGGGSSRSCCNTPAASAEVGYTADDLAGLPQGANLGLGCGNPAALLSLRWGETVLDLGSGGGVDCFIAAKRVGSTGQVIGVDMTPEMLSRARENARKGGYSNVDFRLGEIEHLPLANDSVDVVISNCVVVLVPEKGQVYREAFRVLRPGGRLAFSDVVATRPIPEELRRDPERWSGCSSGALTPGEISSLLTSAGFEDVLIELSAADEVPESLGSQDAIGVVPASIRAVKPATS